MTASNMGVSAPSMNPGDFLLEACLKSSSCDVDPRLSRARGCWIASHKPTPQHAGPAGTERYTNTGVVNSAAMVGGTASGISSIPSISEMATPYERRRVVGGDKDGTNLPTHVRAKLTVYGLRHGDDETTIFVGLDKRGYPATAKFLRGATPSASINTGTGTGPTPRACRVWAIKQSHQRGGQMSFVSGAIGCMTC